MTQTLTLPTADGTLEAYRLKGTPLARPKAAPVFDRIAYAAAHVVSNPLKDHDPWGRPAIDWDATLAFRHHLWDHGFKIAEAMDTSQRGMGVDWPTAAELIARSLAEARTRPGADLACGVGTDNLTSFQSLEDVIAAYEAQFAHVEKHGGRTIMMASRALARLAKGPEDYARVYGYLLRQAEKPVILHWLGEMFDPQLAGYWGGATFEANLETVLSIILENKDKVDGIKISLLDAEMEIHLRRRLPAGVICYTGDDFNYAQLIAGDSHGYSHALLGIFDAITPQASAALAALATGDTARFHAVMAPTVPLSRRIFEAPTQYYKAGVVFLAWLNGHQSHFTMPGGMQSARGISHFADIFRLADAADVLDAPSLAVERMQQLLAVHGIEE